MLKGAFLFVSTEKRRIFTPSETNKPKTKAMKYTAEQIANYIAENINLVPNSNWTIYAGPNGLTHTMGSMEYRDDEHQEVLYFITMDEAPEDMEALIESVEFQMNE